MACQDFGTVAALQYSARPRLDFVDIVEEFDIAFQSGAANQRRLTWDCDDVAIFDRGALRIGLGWMQPGTPGQPWYLIVAVGASPEAGDMPVDRQVCEDLASRIIERTGLYLPHDAVFRSDAAQPVDAGLIDAVTERLAASMAEPGSPPARADPAPRKAATRGPMPWLGAWRGRVHPKPPASPEIDPMELNAESAAMRRLREALCDTTPEAEITLPMHLSIYALGATMLMQAPPVGAALLVYTVLREEFGVSL